MRDVVPRLATVEGEEVEKTEEEEEARKLVSSREKLPQLSQVLTARAHARKGGHEKEEAVAAAGVVRECEAPLQRRHPQEQ